MNRDEILAKSRAENKNKDIADIEAVKNASSFTIIFGAVFAAILYVIQIFTGNGANFSLWATITVMTAAIHLHRFYTLKQKKDLLCGILWSVTSIFIIIMITIKFFG